MDFRLDEEQLELRESVRRLCADRFGIDDLAQRENGSVDRGDWRALAELGVFAVLLPVSKGGPGFGAVGAAIVFEQLGAHLVSGPVLWTTLGASWVDGAANGRPVGGVELPITSDEPILIEHALELDALDRKSTRL